MNERTGAQLRVIKTVTNVLRAGDISAWLFGGWGLDARIGRITRDHGDIEFWLERVDAERSKRVLIGAGATALATQPPEEACEFIWDGVEFSTAYFDRQPGGLFIDFLPIAKARGFPSSDTHLTVGWVVRASQNPPSRRSGLTCPPRATTASPAAVLLAGPLAIWTNQGIHTCSSLNVLPTRAFPGWNAANIQL
jgi:hypothetical protein